MFTVCKVTHFSRIFSIFAAFLSKFFWNWYLFSLWYIANSMTIGYQWRDYILPSSAKYTVSKTTSWSGWNFLVREIYLHREGFSATFIDIVCFWKNYLQYKVGMKIFKDGTKSKWHPRLKWFYRRVFSSDDKHMVLIKKNGKDRYD